VRFWLSEPEHIRNRPGPAFASKDRSPSEA
jgi:hypothetical protein